MKSWTYTVRRDQLHKCIFGEIQKRVCLDTLNSILTNVRNTAIHKRFGSFSTCNIECITDETKMAQYSFSQQCYIIICMEQVSVIFFSSIFPLKHLLLTDSSPHRITSKNDKKIAPSKKVQQNSKANQMLSKINFSYTPIINFASFISNTYNLRKPLHRKLYEVN